MRVAFFVWRFPAPSETFVLNLARTVLDAGHDLEIHSLRDGWGETMRTHPLLDSHRLMDRHRPAGAPESWLGRLRALPVTLGRALRRHGLRALLTVPPFGLDRRTLSLRTVFDAAAVEDGRFDVIHCQFSNIGPAVDRLRQIGLLRGKLVVHVRGTDITKSVRDRGATSYRRLFARVDAVVANSQHFRDAAIAAGCPAGKITVLPSATDMRAFPFRLPEVPRGRPVRLVTVGRLVEKKGIRFAIDALDRLVTAGRDVTLDIVGDGPLRAALTEQAATRGLLDRITFHGMLPSVGVQRLLHESDVFVAASVTASNGDQDAATNTVKEAMATGLPVVATRHGGMPEMVLDGVTGLLAAEGDAADLAARLAALLDAPADWAGLAVAARQKVEAEVSTDVMDARVLALYQSLCRPEPPRWTGAQSAPAL